MIYLDFVFVVNLLIHNLILYSVFKVQYFGLVKIQMVENKGLEPLTPCVQGRCSPSWANSPKMLVFCSVCCVVAPSLVSYIPKYAPSSLSRTPCIRSKILRISHFNMNFHISLRTLSKWNSSHSHFTVNLHFAPFAVFLKNSHSAETFVSLERRWSSRSFSNGYLVTTSPQSLVLP